MRQEKKTGCAWLIEFFKGKIIEAIIMTGLGGIAMILGLSSGICIGNCNQTQNQPSTEGNTNLAINPPVVNNIQPSFECPQRDEAFYMEPNTPYGYFGDGYGILMVPGVGFAVEYPNGYLEEVYVPYTNYYEWYSVGDSPFVYCSTENNVYAVFED